MSQHKMDLKAELKRAWEVALMKKPAMHHVASGGKPETTFGYYVIIVSALLTLLGSYFFLSGYISFGPIYALKTAVIQIVMAVVGIYLISFIAKTLFKGKAGYDAFFRVMAYGYLVTWLGLVPALGIIGGLWLLVLTFVILKEVHKLSTGGAIGTMVVTFILGIIVGSVISALTGFSATSFGGAKLPDYSRGFNIRTETEEGAGSIQMKDGKMTIKGPGGEVMEIEVPQ